MRPRPVIFMCVLMGAVVVAGGCGADQDDAQASPSSTTIDGELAEFAREADQVCESFVPRFAELQDPDGDGGLKPLGTGELMQEGFAELRQVRPPQRYMEAWDEALGTLIEAGQQLAEAERLGLAGESAASDEAQSRALFDLEASAQESLATIPAPFAVCFAE